MSQYVTICHNMSQYVTICHNMSNMSQYVTICHNMSQYVTICQNMSQYVTIMSQYVTICHNMLQYVTICHKQCIESLFSPSGGGGWRGGGGRRGERGRRRGRGGRRWRRDTPLPYSGTVAGGDRGPVESSADQVPGVGDSAGERQVATPTSCV